MKKENMKITKRCTIDLTSGAAKEVDRISNIFGLSIADVFRYALKLMSIYADAEESGKKLALINPNDPTNSQVLMMFAPINKNPEKANEVSR